MKHHDELLGDLCHMDVRFLIACKSFEHHFLEYFFAFLASEVALLSKTIGAHGKPKKYGCFPAGDYFFTAI